MMLKRAEKTFRQYTRKRTRTWLTPGSYWLYREVRRKSSREWCHQLWGTLRAQRERPIGLIPYLVKVPDDDTHVHV